MLTPQFQHYASQPHFSTSNRKRPGGTSKKKNHPHHFGVGIVGESRSDPESDRQNWFCEILEYEEFSKAIPVNCWEVGL